MPSKSTQEELTINIIGNNIDYYYDVTISSYIDDHCPAATYDIDLDEASEEAKVFLSKIEKEFNIKLFDLAIYAGGYDKNIASHSIDDFLEVYNVESGKTSRTLQGKF